MSMTSMVVWIVSYPDFDELRNSERMRDSIRTTGAVVMGRHAYAMGDPDSYVGHYEYQVPIFVLTHAVPRQQPKESAQFTFTFVTDGIASALRQAQAAAGAKDVVVIGGANTAQQSITAGLLDEVHIDIMPVLFGGGLRLFDNIDNIGASHMALERMRVVEFSTRTHLIFRVVK